MALAIALARCWRSQLAHFAHLLLQNRLHLEAEHDVSLDLDFSTQESQLGIELTRGQLDHVLVCETEGDIWLWASRRATTVNCAAFLC